MNVQVNPATQAVQSGVQPPPSPRSLADTGINTVMMRDILLKTVFRTNLSLVSEISRAISLPVETMRASTRWPPGACIFLKSLRIPTLRCKWRWQSLNVSMD